MTALKNLALSVLVWQLLGISAQAAPMSGTTGNWAWWWSSNANSVASLWTPNQLATAFYGPSVTAAPAGHSGLLGRHPRAGRYRSCSRSDFLRLSLGDVGPGRERVHQPRRRSLPAGEPDHDGQCPALVQQQPDLQLLRRPAHQPADRRLRQHHPPARPADVPAERGQRLADDRPDRLAAHTLSLVSNTTSNSVPGVIGMTQIGGSGFSFIDQEAKVSPDARPARVDRRPQHLPRADALLRGRRELRHDRQLYRCQECELVDDDQPQLHVQRSRGPGPSSRARCTADDQRCPGSPGA